MPPRKGDELARERFYRQGRGGCSYCMEPYVIRDGIKTCGCESLSDSLLSEDYALMTLDYTAWQKARRDRVRAYRSQEAFGL